MTTSDGRYSLSYNGEIYNYKELRAELISLGHSFTGCSDSEVLLFAWSEWGVSTLKKVSGMFAFAIFDNQSGLLHIARDHCGIKPLFYVPSLENGVWAFSSEIESLFRLLPAKTRKICPEVIHNYLAWGLYDNSRITFFDEVLSLPPGHYLCFDVNKGMVEEPVSWWYPSIQPTKKNISFEQASEELRDRLFQSVRLHMQSDVPLGVALSGGLDSSILACLIRSLYPSAPIHTFTFADVSLFYNETKWASVVNDHINSIPQYISITPDEFAADIDALIASQGEPFMSTSVYAQYRVYKAARDSGISVIIDGQGADEIFAGYSGYPEARLSSLSANHEYSKSVSFLYSWSQWPGRSFAQALRMAMLEFLPESIVSTIRGLKSGSHTNLINTDWFLEHCSPLQIEPSRHPTASPKTRSLISALRDSVCREGLPCLLRHADRSSMACSVESRVPFLAPSLVEYVFSLPEEYLVSNDGQTKAVLRHALRGIVPDCVLDRRDKIGFRTSEMKLMASLISKSHDFLHSISSLPFIHAHHFASDFPRLVNESQSMSLIWRLYNVTRWLEVMNVSM